MIDHRTVESIRQKYALLRLEDKTPMPLPHDRGGYFDLSTDLAATVRRQMVQALQQMGIRIEASHHEVAAGQHELLNWIVLAGAMCELGKNAAILDYVESYVMNSNKCFAVF